MSLINTILTPRGAMSPAYYNWLFHTTSFADEFYKWGHGIVDDLWTTRWDDMKRIAIPTPPYSEQERIAAFLDERCAKIDGMIAEAKASIEDYKKWKQSIIFEAVTGKHEKNLKPSGVDWIGAVPEGWKVVKVRQVGKTSSGATPSRGREGEYFEGASIRWVKTLDLNDGVVIETQERITELALADSSCAILPVGTVMVAMYGGSGTIGKCGLLAKPSTTNQAVCSIVLDRSLVDPKYLLWYLVSIKSAWMYYAVGTRKDPNINQEIVAQFRLPLPLLPEQRRIAAFLDVKCAAIDKLVGEKEALIADLEAYKKSLIFETVTGKREVA